MNISNYLDAIAKPFQGLAPWILRLVLGTSFILHGYGKFPLPPERMVKMFESGGMPAPDVVASMVAIGEVGCRKCGYFRWIAWCSRAFSHKIGWRRSCSNYDRSLLPGTF